MVPPELVTERRYSPIAGQVLAGSSSGGQTAGVVGWR